MEICYISFVLGMIKAYVESNCYVGLLFEITKTYSYYEVKIAINYYMSFLFSSLSTGRLMSKIIFFLVALNV